MSTTTLSQTGLVAAQDLPPGARIAYHPSMNADIQWLTVVEAIPQDADPRFVTVSTLHHGKEISFTAWGGLRFAALTAGVCAYQVGRTISPCTPGPARGSKPGASMICLPHRGELLRLHSSVCRT